MDEIPELKKITTGVKRLGSCPECGAVGMSDGTKPCWPCRNGGA